MLLPVINLTKTAYALKYVVLVEAEVDGSHKVVVAVVFVASRGYVLNLQQMIIRTN